MTTTRGLVDAVVRGAVGYEPGLDSLTVAPAAEVDGALTAALRDACERLWTDGWQPVELHRVVARLGRVPMPDLVRDAVAAHVARFPKGRVDERWRAQVATLDARVWWSPDVDHLTAFARAHRLDRTGLIDTVLGLLTVLSGLPAIEVLVPPPGTTARRNRSGRDADAGLLKRVRALLAKAESTSFPAEAETYTAKAQELIARHSIDEALLDADDPSVVPFARRIGVDHPYESEKASLLHAVAAANRCHAVWSQDLGFSTVFGYDADIDAVDLLYTSLLLQANRAMARAEPGGGKAGRARLKTFRRSFLVAFAVRIGERLAETARAAVTEMAGATATEPATLLPVLADRDERVRETMHRVFPRTTRARSSRVDSIEGWDSGVEAADRAGIDGRVGPRGGYSSE
ncbi:DUF2786 domain-containing protein [Virgisporangium ochraceum]|uniref:PI-PLC Y-box domain-containing protein n=1 Tax=Virgisporangium ochraceum TaxID=65505 RepID=A0A8J4A0K7_9ACTN|nr:DUF2786 domain-containing protein [Virgisporangium ochraceum]GIJ73654.1 hypothetical protein Voc01_085710 [Virgisporangium ochraceum]